MTRYQVPVALPLLEQRDSWLHVVGIRVVSEDGPWGDHLGVMLCTVEDDCAPAELEGKLVELTLRRVFEDIEDIEVIDRTVIGD
jgi:hypothetical protein